MIIEAVFIVLPFFAGVAAGSERVRTMVASVLALVSGLVLFSISVLEQPLLAAAVTTLSLGTPGFVFGLWLTRWRPLMHNIGLGGVAFIAGAVMAAGFDGGLQPWVRSETVQTAMWVEASPEPVWSSLKAFDTIEGERPLLMRLGMPTPLRCALESEALGARRTCHFDRGHLVQGVTAWEPPVHLGLQVTENDLSAQLFTLTQADYRLTAQDGQTHVLRSTDFVSKLTPAWFWRPLERLSVEGEQRYLLHGLEGRFVEAERGVPVRLTVSTHPPSTVTIVPMKGSNRPRIELGRTPLREQAGAFVGDTVLMVNEAQGIHAEESIDWGYPDEIKVISKVFKK